MNMISARRYASEVWNYAAVVSVPLSIRPSTTSRHYMDMTEQVGFWNECFRRTWTSVAAPRAWNSLPDAIRRSPSLAVFKRSLKTHFYIQCFY